MNKLIAYFESIGFTGEPLHKISEAIEVKTYKKYDYVVQEGKTSRHLGFVESGVFQYYVNLDGEEKTTYVNIENTFLASVMSFVSETPALENIRALTDGCISLISRANLKRLVEEIPSFKNFYINLLEFAVCGIDESRHDLIVLNAEQRYEKMLRKQPQLLQHIPLQHLASMLGITARHLSRIRNNIR